MKGKLHFIGNTFVVTLATISVTDSKLTLGKLWLKTTFTVENMWVGRLLIYSSYCWHH